MRLCRVLIALLFVVTPVYAKTVYVTDNLELPLRSEESNKGKIISLLPTGTPLTLLNENSKTGFSHVQLKNGMQGYISTRNTMPEPPNRSKLESTEKTMEFLQTENNALKEELKKLKTSIAPGNTVEQNLTAERERLERELDQIKKTANQQIELKNERDQLQERLVDVEREFRQLKLENNAMKDGAMQDWFLYGGLLALAGVILGFMLPKLAWRRSNNWDRY